MRALPISIAVIVAVCVAWCVVPNNATRPTTPPVSITPEDQADVDGIAPRLDIVEPKALVDSGVDTGELPEPEFDFRAPGAFFAWAEAPEEIQEELSSGADYYLCTGNGKYARLKFKEGDGDKDAEGVRELAESALTYGADLVDVQDQHIRDCLKHRIYERFDTRKAAYDYSVEHEFASMKSVIPRDGGFLLIDLRPIIEEHKKMQRLAGEATGELWKRLQLSAQIAVDNQDY